MRRRLIKAAAAPRRPAEAEDDLHVLTDMDVPLVSLVDRGANRQSKFLMVKIDAEKAVPAADAPAEDKRAAQETRSKKYGIEILSTNSALSYPADAPTTETLYGDPVNIKYPLGGTDNQPDAARVRNALARFKQNAAVYTEDAARGKVYARIVEQALALGIDVSYDPEDPVDALLPADLKDRLTAAQAKRDVAAWCADTVAALDGQLTAIALRDATPAVPPRDPAPPQVQPEPPVDHEEVAALRKQLDDLRAVSDAQATDLERAQAALRKALLAETRRHQGAVGTPAGLRPAAPTSTNVARAAGTTPPTVLTAWQTGQRLKPRKGQENG